MTTNTWLRELATRYTPQDGELEQARRRVESIGRLLTNSDFGVLDFEIGGSCGKWTAIRPVEDIDMFVYLDEQAWINTRGGRYQPSRVLGLFRERLTVAKALHIENRSIVVRPQNRSVRLRYLKEGAVHLDIVPAFWVNQNAHRVAEIPDREAKGWIRTCVRRQANLIERYDDSFHSLRRAIRLLKLWRDRHRLKPLRSYALELLAVHSVIEGAPRSEVGIFRHVLEFLVASRLRTPILIEDVIKHYDIPRSAVVIMDVGVRDNNVASNIDANTRKSIVASAKTTLQLLREADEALAADQQRIARGRFRQAVGA